MENPVTGKPRLNSKTMAALAMLAAMAYLLMLIGRVPIMPSVPFLKYDPKDIAIIIGGYLYGPFSAMLISLTVSFVEMFTVSESGLIGFVMNVLSTCMFVCPAAFFYRKKPSLQTAVIGLVTGVALMSATMVLWNYFITPLYMKVTREIVAGMLLPVFLPFNLIKGGLNAAVTMLLYKPVVTLLRRSNLVAESTGDGRMKLGVIVISALVLITLVLYILVLNGRI